MQPDATNYCFTYGSNVQRGGGNGIYVTWYDKLLCFMLRLFGRGAIAHYVSDTTSYLCYEMLMQLNSDTEWTELKIKIFIVSSFRSKTYTVLYWAA